MTTFFDFNRWFDSKSASKNKNKRKPDRVCRIEELESREMLSASPWSLPGDGCEWRWDDQPLSLYWTQDFGSLNDNSVAAAPSSGFTSLSDVGSVDLTNANIDLDLTDYGSVGENWVSTFLDLTENASFATLFDTTEVVGVTEINSFRVGWEGEWFSIIEDGNFAEGWGFSSDYTWFVHGVSMTKLSAPTLGTVNATGNSTISVTWNTVSDASGYKVDYRAGTGTWLEAGKEGDATMTTPQLSGTTWSATIGNLAINTPYEIRVSAIGTGAYHNSDPSSPTKSATTWMLPPTTPTDFDVDDKTYSSITLMWTAQDDVTYTLEIKGGSEYPDWSSDWTGIVGNGTVTFDGLTENTPYEFRLTATNTGGSVDVTTSETTSVKPENAPDAPHFTGTTPTTNSVTLTWTVQSDVAYTLSIKGGDVYPDWTSDWTGTEGNGTATFTNLTADTFYEFHLTATNTSGSASSTTHATTLSETPQPTGKAVDADGIKGKKKNDLYSDTLTGVKAGKTAKTESALTFTWTNTYKSNGDVRKNELSKHEDTVEFRFDVYAPKPKGIKEKDREPIASIVLKAGDLEAVASANGKTWTFVDCEVTIKGDLSSGFTITITGLKSGTKYEMRMQTVGESKNGNSAALSKITKVSASTQKYTAPRKASVTDKGLGTATISLKSASNVAKATDTVKNGFKGYEVGILVNGNWFFGEQANTYWAGQGIAVDYNGKVDGKAVITGLGGQKYTFGIREVAYTGTTESDKGAVFATSAIATFSVQPTRYAAVKNNGSTGTLLQWKANDAVAKPADTESIIYQKSYEVGIYSGKAVVFPGDADWEAVFSKSPYTSIGIGNDGTTFTTEDLSIVLTGVSTKVSFAVREIITKTEGGATTVVAKSATMKVTVKG